MRQMIWNLVRFSKFSYVALPLAMSLNHNHFHHRVFASGSCEVLRQCSGYKSGGSFVENLIPKSTGFRVGL